LILLGLNVELSFVIAAGIRQRCGTELVAQDKQDAEEQCSHRSLHVRVS
jgi:hypothetical protein